MSQNTNDPAGKAESNADHVSLPDQSATFVDIGDMRIWVTYFVAGAR